MSFTKKITFALIAFAFITSHTINPARAGEADVKNAVEDVKTDTKKGVRKLKRKARKAMGTNTVGKTVQDKIEDAKDDIGNSVKKTKNKIED